MADNYLEQRMADLTSGKLRKELRQPLPPRQNIALITSGVKLDPTLRQSLAARLRRNSRIALITDDTDASQTLTLDGAIRYYPLTESPTTQIPGYLSNLLRAWHNLSTIFIVSDPETTENITRAIETLYTTLPAGIYTLPAIRPVTPSELSKVL